MPAPNAPRSREKYVTSGSKGVQKKGSGIGGGPAGSSSGYSGRTGGSGGSGVTKAAAGGGGGLIVLIIIVVFILKGFGGGAGTGTSTPSATGTGTGTGSGVDFISNLGNQGSTGGNNDSFTPDSNVKLDTTVAPGSREKRTRIIGGGQDTITLLVYMCGTDLESKYGMASNDLGEMAGANLSDKINIIVYTGGCNNWKTSGISTKVNQIYQVQKGGIKQLVADDGAKPMTDPNTLSSFIKWGASNYPADRYELILWDHGGGSVSGYGYDEKYKSSGSMNLSNINKALKAGGVTFDFIGFDACLMATAETAIMLDKHADYMIASEETEPGIGWYYTNWLNKLSENTSMPTIEIGKNIIDDFVAECNRKCGGQKTTLSIIDLAEFSNTVPSKLTDFSKGISDKIEAKEYKTISDARYATREFATSSKIDQVDLVDLATNIGTPEAKALADALTGAIKYNRTSLSMTKAYGVSIYFPYKRVSYVDTVSQTYSDIGMDSEYTKAIKSFAKLETTGQISAGGTSNPLGSLLGSAYGNSSSGGSSDVIGQLLGSFMSGGRNISIDGLTGSNIGFMQDASVSNDAAADYISTNYFDSANLVWEKDGDKYLLDLPDSQWELVHAIDMNVFYDDGEGYIDLGLDNVYSVEDGKLVAETDRTWISIDHQPVAYYRESLEDDGENYTITGRVPALIDGERVNLILVFDNENPHGYVAGVAPFYTDDENPIEGKAVTEIPEGTEIQFICDFYSYDGVYQDTYHLGDAITYKKDILISNGDVGSGAVKITYRFTDIYNQEYWTEAIDN